MWGEVEGGDGKFDGHNHHTRSTEYTPLYKRHSTIAQDVTAAALSPLSLLGLFFSIHCSLLTFGTIQL